MASCYTIIYRTLFYLNAGNGLARSSSVCFGSTAFMHLSKYWIVLQHENSFCSGIGKSVRFGNIAIPKGTKTTVLLFVVFSFSFSTFHCCKCCHVMHWPHLNLFQCVPWHAFKSLDSHLCIYLYMGVAQIHDFINYNI